MCYESIFLIFYLFYRAIWRLSIFFEITETNEDYLTKGNDICIILISINDEQVKVGCSSAFNHNPKYVRTVFVGRMDIRAGRDAMWPKGPAGVTVCLAAFVETQLRCRKRSCAQLVQLRAANAASAARAPIRSAIGSMGPQKPNEQYIERRWRSWRSQRSWCSCAQPTQPAQPELQFEVL